MSDHERVKAALQEFDALSPVQAQEALSPLERGIAMAVYDADEVDTMHQANRVARAVREYLVGHVQVQELSC